MNFSDKELKELDAHLHEIEKIINAKTFALSSDQRKNYKSIASQNNKVVEQALQYMDHHPEWVPNFIDKEEFDRDFLISNQIDSRLQLIQDITQRLKDTKILLDHDIYNNVLSFYRMVRHLATEKEPGANTVYQDIKRIFGSNAIQENMSIVK
ncbi:hypothetical protein ACE939_04665 [Aquimarina sp. W85]|uniref:hypothetical protein n=1 Tax=Aquimarina rhodophyticola TaxID=3342246 RepID=UPI00366C3019